MWRGLARGARVFVPAAILGAVVAALLVIGDPVPEATWTFGLRAVASAAMMIFAIWLILGAAATAVDGDARWSMPPARLLVGVLAAVVGAVAAGILSPLLPIVVAAIALPVLSALAVRPWVTPIRTVVFSPIRALLGLVWLVLLFIVGWLIALVLGFFVTGPVAAGFTWLVFGIGTAILATYWAALHRRAIAHSTATRAVPATPQSSAGAPSTTP